MKTFWSIVIAALILTLAFLGGRATKTCPPPNVRIDTLVIRDTIRDTIPVEKVRYVTRIERDTTLKVIHDTVTNVVYVEVPIEKTQYKSDAYDLWIEGYRARLLSIDVFRETLYIDRTETHTIKTKPRWGLGVHVGYGYNFNDKLTPYIGVGVQYNILTW